MMNAAVLAAARAMHPGFNTDLLQRALQAPQRSLPRKPAASRGTDAAAPDEEEKQVSLRPVRRLQAGCGVSFAVPAACLGHPSAQQRSNLRLGVSSSHVTTAN
jgi:hypothetical protein